MSNSWLDPLLVFVLLLNFLLLGSTRLRPVIYAIALQGLALAALLPIVHAGVEHETLLPRTALLAIATLALRGILIPRVLFFAMRRADVRWQVDSVIGPISSVLIGVAGAGLALAYGKSLPLEAEHASTLVAQTSLSTLLTGFIILITRRKAINLVLGYMVLENGVFLFGLLLVAAIPFLVEIGVLMDLFVGVLLMGITLRHVNREVESIGAESLAALRE